MSEKAIEVIAEALMRDAFGLTTVTTSARQSMKILTALNAARIAVVELPEADSTRYNEGEEAEFPPADRLAWLHGMGYYGVTFWPECPKEVRVAYNNEPGESVNVSEARRFAAALLAAADAAEGATS